MSPNIQLRRPIHCRRSRNDPSPPPAPPVVHVAVRWLGDTRYLWQFDQPFDDPGPGGWIPDDFVGLTVDGLTPDGIDEVVGVDGALTLTYFLAHAGSFHVVDTPAVLRFANGATVLVPDSGPVGT